MEPEELEAIWEAEPERTHYREQPQRTCRYGHGPLGEEPNNWALTGMNVFGDSAPPPGQSNVINGQAYILRLFRCKTCGYCELIDQEL